MKRAAIALGSNLGDRVTNLRTALAALADAGVRPTRLSRLYESAPAYVLDQPPFINAAALVESTLPPLELLAALKAAEAALGRRAGGRRFGPRPIDLDIIFYEGDTVAEGERLIVPHPRWQERDFVKAPLADLAPDDGPARGGGDAGLIYSSGSSGSSGSAELDRALALAARLWRAGGGEARLGGDALAPVLPMGRLGVWRWRARCQVMGILNATPDSFSDGGALGGSAAAALAAGRALVAAGADVLDVGGQSTRPGAARVSAAEEAARVVPVIAALAADPVTGAVPLSVDTFYASVAEAAVAAGATMVNDVSGGGLDARMHASVAALGVPYILMHMRGDPTTMQSAENTAYTEVVAEVAAELRQKAAAAAAAGVESWRLVLDPGLGFAKGGEDNVRLMAGLPRLRAALGPPLRGAPLLVGPSRKGFLGALTGRAAPAARDAATAAAAALAAAGGANVVRAHDAAGVRDALRVADAAVAAGGGAPWAPLHER